MGLSIIFCFCAHLYLSLFLHSLGMVCHYAVYYSFPVSLFSLYIVGSLLSCPSEYTEVFEKPEKNDLCCICISHILNVFMFLTM